MLYFRLYHRDTLHFCENCQHVKRMLAGPQGRYTVLDGKMSGFELCNECQAKARRDDCYRGPEN